MPYVEGGGRGALKAGSLLDLLSLVEEVPRSGRDKPPYGELLAANQLLELCQPRLHLYFDSPLLFLQRFLAVEHRVDLLLLLLMKLTLQPVNSAVHEQTLLLDLALRYQPSLQRSAGLEAAWVLVSVEVSAFTMHPDPGLNLQYAVRLFDVVV